MVQQHYTLSNSTHCHKAAVGQVDMLQNNRFMSVPHSLFNMASGCYCVHAENTHSKEHSGPPPLLQVKQIPLKLVLHTTVHIHTVQRLSYPLKKPFWNYENCTVPSLKNTTARVSNMTESAQPHIGTSVGRSLFLYIH